MHFFNDSISNWQLFDEILFQTAELMPIRHIAEVL